MTRKINLIAQGAEAKIYLTDNIISKQRTPKSYRHPKLDKQIRTRRTRSEAKILKKAKEFINVPKVLNTNTFDIQIEYIKGEKLSLTLDSYPEEKQFQLMQQLGSQTALLHENNIIHGDLTTSNVILQQSSGQKKLETAEQLDTIRDTHSSEASWESLDDRKIIDAKHQLNSKEDKIFIIDFGLSFISTKIEDKAVDIHLIKQALVAKHFQNDELLFKNFLKGYNPKEKDKILERLEAVEKRGRYRH